MGLDFIRRAAPTFKKSWNRGAKELAQPTLFTRHPEHCGRTILADLNANTVMPVGREVVIQILNGEMCLVDGLTSIGKVTQPPADLIQIVKDVGCAKGRIERTNALGGTVDVAIQ